MKQVMVEVRKLGTNESFVWKEFLVRADAPHLAARWACEDAQAAGYETRFVDVLLEQF